MSTEIPDFNKLDLDSRIDTLSKMLDARDPLIVGHLREIHKICLQHEELVHLLTDEQIRIWMRAQKAHTNVLLVKEITEKKPRATKVPKASAADF
jgi:hypothetical protein